MKAVDYNPGPFSENFPHCIDEAVVHVRTHASDFFLSLFGILIANISRSDIPLTCSQGTGDRFRLLAAEMPGVWQSQVNRQKNSHLPDML